MEMMEDDHGAYIMNSRDLCTMPRLNELLDVGLDSFKIEGRNKSEYYVAISTRAYRKAIDDWAENPTSWSAEKYVKELETLQNRGYTLGFLDGNAGPESLNYDISASNGEWRYAGRVMDKTEDSLIFEIKHKIEKGDVVEFLSPEQFEPICITMDEFYDAQSGKALEVISTGHLGQAIRIPLKKEILDKLPILSVARKFIGNK
jgi:putative protease